MGFFASQRADDGCSLFERIRRVDTPVLCRRIDDELVMRIASVRRHLLNVLNTRPGNCRSAPKLGVVDLNDASYNKADMQGAVGEAIRQCICRYEPRLHEVCVKSDGDADPAMCFQVTGQIKIASRMQEVSFSVFTRDQRHYKIQ